MSETPEESHFSQQQKSPEQVRREQKIKSSLNDNFNKAYLEILVSRLGDEPYQIDIDFENVEGETKEKTIINLISYMIHRNKLEELEGAIQEELTRPRRVSRWFHQGQNIFIVSIVGIIAITIVALVILPFLNLNKSNLLAVTPTAPNMPTPTYPPPSPPTVILHSFEGCPEQLQQDFESKLAVISNLKILPPGDEAALEINGRCTTQEIILTFTHHEKAPVFLQVATPDSITIILPIDTETRLLGQLGRALIYYQDNQFKNAYDAFSGVAGTITQQKDLDLLMANTQLLSYEYEQAIEKYKQLLAQSDQTDREYIAALHNNLGVTYFNHAVKAEMALDDKQVNEYQNKALAEFEQGLLFETQLSEKTSTLLHTNKSQVIIWRPNPNESEAAISCKIVQEQTPENPWSDICESLPKLIELRIEHLLGDVCNYDQIQEISHLLQDAQNKNPNLADTYFWQASTLDIAIKSVNCGLEKSEIEEIRQNCFSYFNQFKLQNAHHLAPLYTHIYMNSQENILCLPKEE